MMFQVLKNANVNVFVSMVWDMCNVEHVLNIQTEFGGGWHKTTTAEHSWSYTSDQNSPTVCFNGHSVTMYSRGLV